MTTRISLFVAGLVTALALSACGGGTHASVSARDESTTTTSTTTTTEPSTTAPASTVAPVTSAPVPTVRPVSGFKTVEYAGLRFQVPDNWPVYDLAKDPTRCVRFDQHAVYLGHAGANQRCPAHLVGRTDAVQVEPIDATSRATEARATIQTVVNGLPVREDPSSAVTHSIVAAFDATGVVATVTFRNDDGTANQIVGTFEQASG
jgi:hypothetical protein